MRKYIIVAIAFISIIICSCKKESSENSDDTFVTVIPTDTQMAVVSCFTASDNNYIIVGRSNNPKPSGYIGPFQLPSPGVIVKLNQQGVEMWRKPVHPMTSYLWDALPVKGGGFITVGYDDPGIKAINVVRYDENGIYVASSAVVIPENAGSCTLNRCIQLSNGNFIFAFGEYTGGTGYGVVTDNAFNVLRTNNYLPPGTGYTGCFVNSVVQIDDSTIGLAGFTYKVDNFNVQVVNSLVITAGLNGAQKTYNLVSDSVYSETSTYLGINRKGLLAVTATMNGKNTGEGTWVNYFNNSQYQLISGRINLINCDSSGALKGRKKIYSYPGFGIINSLKNTSDGGFILCGTVNQSIYQTIDVKTQVYLLKLDADLNEQWSEVYTTIYPAFGMDVFEIPGEGYLVAGHQYSMNRHFNMLVIKTRPDGSQ